MANKNGFSSNPSDPNPACDHGKSKDKVFPKGPEVNPLRSGGGEKVFPSNPKAYPCPGNVKD